MTLITNIQIKQRPSKHKVAHTVLSPRPFNMNQLKSDLIFLFHLIVFIVYMCINYRFIFELNPAISKSLQFSYGGSAIFYTTWNMVRNFE